MSISFENERVRNVALKPRLDGFFVWKEKSIAQSQPFQVEIHPYLDSGEAGEVWDDLEYKDGLASCVCLNVSCLAMV